MTIFVLLLSGSFAVLIMQRVSWVDRHLLQDNFIILMKLWHA